MRFYFVNSKYHTLAEFVAISLEFDYDTVEDSVEFEIMDDFFDISQNMFK